MIELAVDALSEEERRVFEDAFGLFDKDQNGNLDLEEIHNVLQELGKNMSRDEILDSLYDADVGHTGSITQKEFVKMMAGENLFKTRQLSDGEKQMVQAIFAVFDDDQD